MNYKFLSHNKLSSLSKVTVLLYYLAILSLKIRIKQSFFDLYMFYIYAEHIEVLALRKTGFGLFTFPYTGNVNKCAVEI